MELKIEEEKISAEATVLKLKGNIDSMDHEVFREAVMTLFDRGIKIFLLDATGIKYISSSGIGALFEMYKQAEARGGSLRIFNPQLGVRRVLEIVKGEFLELDLQKLTAESPFYAYLEPHLPKDEPSSPQSAAS